MDKQEILEFVDLDEMSHDNIEHNINNNSNVIILLLDNFMWKSSTLIFSIHNNKVLYKHYIRYVGIYKNKIIIHDLCTIINHIHIQIRITIHEVW